MDQQETTQRSDKPKAKRNGAVLVASFIAAIIILFFGINYILVHNDIKDADKQSENLSEQISLLTTNVEKQQRLPENILKEATAFAKEERLQVTPVFDILLKEATDDAALTGITFNESGLQIKMNFSTLQDATAYEKALVKNKDVFENVKMDKVAAYTPVSEDELASKPDIATTARYQAVYNVTLNKAQLQKAQQKAGNQ